MYRIIVLNPGSTSTKVALYEGDKRIFSETVDHPASDLAGFANIVDQLPYRKEIITKMLKGKGVDPATADAFSAICTGLLPMDGGVYEVNEKMYAHGQVGPGSRHPGNLGPLLARDFADEFGGRAFIVDASSVDEFEEEARMTGFVEVLRTSRGHPLNQRAAARKYASDCGKLYEELNLVVAHLGGGVSVSAHCRGKMIDTVDSTRGEGRMAPTRSGTAPLADVIELCYSGRYTEKEMLTKVMKTGGWTAHLGTSDAREVERRIEEGDRYAALVYRTTAYQIAKDIAAMAAVMKGKVDAIILTGGVAYSEMMTEMLKERVGFIAPVEIYPGEFEMDALAAGAIRVLEGKEEPKYYTGEPVFPGFDVVYSR
ncbi:butyrate kinase [Faecalicatena contorta]|uniref:butyrate kinase n=1 Tax=Faecalicatena contorta TaxID=39482 RepID=UPI001F24E291|nr:butyrate kinase [Faecalicatena contorta]MCF2679243.1 butyrate kinase [Faecalicatena contorta]